MLIAQSLSLATDALAGLSWPLATSKSRAQGWASAYAGQGDPTDLGYCHRESRRRRRL